MNYILDTSCILYNWNVINSFPQDNVYIPFAVLKQLDRFKTEIGQNGVNARKACNFICKYMNQDKNSLTKKYF